jgi:hypothetical protein
MNGFFSFFVFIFVCAYICMHAHVKFCRVCLFKFLALGKLWWLIYVFVFACASACWLLFSCVFVVYMWMWMCVPMSSPRAPARPYPCSCQAVRTNAVYFFSVWVSACLWRVFLCVCVFLCMYMFVSLSVCVWNNINSSLYTAADNKYLSNMLVKRLVTRPP